MTYERKFEAEAGALTRGGLRRLLGFIKHEFSEVDLSWFEDKGWIESVFYVTFKGEENLVNEAVSCYRHNFRKLE